MEIYRGKIEGAWRSCQCNTRKVIGCEEISPNKNILHGRFVLATEDEGTNKEIWKEIFVLRGHKGNMEQSLVHDT